MFTPLFLYLLFGMAEMGLYFRTYISMGAALADGSRSGAILGNAMDVDFQIIQEVERALAAVPTEDIKVLVVFDAGAANPSNPAGATAPSACTQPAVTTPVSLTSTGARCNAYTPATDWPETDKRLYGCVLTPPDESTRSAGWCPYSERKVAATSAGGNGPPDYIGIYLRVEHRYMTGMFGRTKTAEQTMVARLEPQTLS